MFQLENVTSVHLEVTDKCNANCPMCPRTYNGGRINPNLRNIEMSVELARQVFPPAFVKKLHFLQMCGNFGDPIVAKDTIEILQYLREVNPNISLGIHTNGSARTADWWAQLGKILSRPGDYCKFALDGLEDTNHIYRRNTSWPRIMTAVESFIAAGGVAHWEFLVFQHNEHQVELARQMAKQMGFKAFFVKKTSRFFDYKTGTNQPFPILDKAEQVVGHLYPPVANEFVNPVSLFVQAPPTEAVTEEETTPAPLHNESSVGKKMAESIRNARKAALDFKKKFSGMNDYLQKTSVDCLAIRDRSIYVSAAGEVFPCCFLGGQIRYDGRGPDGDRLEQIAAQASRDPEKLDGINAQHRPIQDILKSKDWFGAIAETWSNETPEEQRIGTCRRICGANLHIVTAEYG